MRDLQGLGLRGSGVRVYIGLRMDQGLGFREYRNLI